MPLIKDKQISENTWAFLADEDELKDGDISVSLGRWKTDKERILNRSGKIGIRLTTTDNVADLADDLSRIDLIELDFPVFTDGRAFSQARLLRSRYHFRGEIRATGNFMLDQIFYLNRVGINAFELSEAQNLEHALSALNDFSVSYQVSTL